MRSSRLEASTIADLAASLHEGVVGDPEQRRMPKIAAASSRMRRTMRTARHPALQHVEGGAPFQRLHLRAILGTQEPGDSFDIAS